MIDNIGIDVVCVKNLKIEGFNLKNNGTEITFDYGFNPPILLLVGGTLLVTNIHTEEFRIFEAPHTISLEPDSIFVLKVVDCEEAYVYAVTALRNKEGDIIDDSNLVRSNYPLATHIPYEE